MQCILTVNLITATPLQLIISMYIVHPHSISNNNIAKYISSQSENGIKIHKTKKHTHTCRCCNQTFTDQELYSNHIGECYSTYSYYDSPMISPGRFPPRFPPRYPHTSPQRYPPTFPPHFPRSPLY